MKRNLLSLVLVACCLTCGLGFAGKDPKHWVTGPEELAKIVEKQGSIGKYEAKAIREGTSEGKFVFENGTLKYMFFIMKMMILIQLGGSGLN